MYHRGSWSGKWVIIRFLCHIFFVVSFLMFIFPVNPTKEIGNSVSQSCYISRKVECYYENGRSPAGITTRTVWYKYYFITLVRITIDRKTVGCRCYCDLRRTKKNLLPTETIRVSKGAPAWNLGCLAVSYVIVLENVEGICAESSKDFKV